MLEAPPGAGKTTRVPPALLSAGLGGGGEILVAEPRRLAARLAALRVAFELGERPGETVGYSVRFEDVGGPKTRIRYVTLGVLLRRLLGDAELRGVGTVVLDEFHERQLDADLALVLLERLRQRARPDLCLLVMSATLEAGPVAALLGDCPRIRSEGRLFPVRIDHAERPDERPLEKQVVSGVRGLLAEAPPGDLLVFLPGAAEIRRATDALGALASERGLLLLPLHGDLPLEQQARAVEPGPRPKLILSTNVAESSVTIDGVVGVVDSGLVRLAGHSPWTGLPTLAVAKISRAAAVQRAGRAGRTRPGVVVRLYTRGDFESRPEHETPEIRRRELSEALLLLHGAGVDDVRGVRWLDAPDAAALDAAEGLLSRLGALDADARLTEIGRRMLSLPLVPRLARVVVEGERRGVASEAATLGALLGERDIRFEARARLGRGGPHRDASGPSDVLELLDRFEEAREGGLGADRLRALGLDVRSVQAVDRAARQLERLVRRGGERPDSPEAVEQALCIAVFQGFSDRVARRRQPGSRDLILANGGVAQLAETSVVHDAQLVVVVDAEKRPLGRSSGILVRLASAIDAEWLLDLHPELLSEADELSWNDAAGRVEQVSRIACGSVVLDETRRPAAPSPEASRLLARAALGRRDADVDGALGRLALRLAVVREAMPELGLPALQAEDASRLVEAACEGRTSLAELTLDSATLASGLLPPAALRALFENAPERITLPGGRSVQVSYEPDRPPFIASRLQEFFGSATGPSVCKGRVPLTLHLLAPNQRAVQVTNDLSGFWERHYPTLRKQLMRRYPKHAWPEQPLLAKPPAPRR